MKAVGLLIMLGLGAPSFAKTSTDLLLCGALELCVSLLNGVATGYSSEANSDNPFSYNLNQTESASQFDHLSKASSATYGLSAGLMALAAAISMFDSRIDYEGPRTKTVPTVVAGIAFGTVVASSIGLVTSGISFKIGNDRFKNMLGTSMGSTIANWIVFISALKWVHSINPPAPTAPDAAPTVP